MRFARACALVCLLLVAARPARAQTPPAASATDLSIVLARGGALVRVRIEGDRLVARSAAGDITQEHAIGASDRDRLIAAARLAASDPRPQSTCPDDETFVSVTLGGRTTSSAVCPKKNAWFFNARRWQAMLALVRGLLDGKR